MGIFCYTGPAANGRLTYNSKTEEGEVHFGDLWAQNDIVYRLDVLQDWIADLEAEYERLAAGENPLILNALQLPIPQSPDI